MVEYTQRKIIKYLVDLGFKKNRYYDKIYLEKEIQEDNFCVFIRINRCIKFIYVSFSIGIGNRHEYFDKQINARQIEDMIDELNKLIDETIEKYKKIYDNVFLYVEKLLQENNLIQYYSKKDKKIIYQKGKVIYKMHISFLKDFLKNNVEKYIKKLKQIINILDLFNEKQKELIRKINKEPFLLLKYFDYEIKERLKNINRVERILGQDIKKQYDKLNYELDLLIKENQKQKELINKI